MQQLILFTSSWTNSELGSLNAQMVAISRGKPRWKLPFRHRVLSDLAPSREAFGLEDPAQFESVYRSGLEEIGLEKILEALERIRRDSGGRALVLLCWEPAGEF